VHAQAARRGAAWTTSRAQHGARLDALAAAVHALPTCSTWGRSSWTPRPSSARATTALRSGGGGSPERGGGGGGADFGASMLGSTRYSAGGGGMGRALGAAACVACRSRGGCFREPSILNVNSETDSLPFPGKLSTPARGNAESHGCEGSIPVLFVEIIIIIIVCGSEGLYWDSYPCHCTHSTSPFVSDACRVDSRLTGRW